ncbi:hypothetical protein D3C71_988810 [compost metagenome]
MAGHLLGPLERAIDRPGPADGKVVLVVALPYLIDRRQHAGHVVGETILGGHVVQRAEQAAFGAAAVVAKHGDDQGVVGIGQRVHRIQQPAHMLVQVGQEAGEAFHLAGKQALFVGSVRVPGRQFRRARGQLRIRRDRTDLLLALEQLGPVGIPAHVKASLERGDVAFRHMVRGVHRTRCPVQEPRAIRGDRLAGMQPFNRLGGQVIGEVVALLGSLVRLHRRGVAEQLRGELIGLPAHEPVEGLEPLAGGPAVEGPHRAGFPIGGVVPLAERRRGVAVVGQHLGNGGVVIGPHAVVAGEAGGAFGNGAVAGAVMVAPGQQRGPGG